MYREVIKDIEDLEGDRQFGCRTLPVVAGISFAKKFAMVWMLVLLIVLSIALPVIWQYTLVLFFWVLITVVLPGILSVYWLFQARTKAQFHRLSQLVKIIMVAGTLSLIVVNI
jgi:4-hydroxybenzoate polyprenyltransferase